MKIPKESFFAPIFILIISLTVIFFLVDQNSSSASTFSYKKIRVENTASNLITNKWRNDTITLLDKTSVEDGSFTGNLAYGLEEYDPYTSNYAIDIYQALHQPLPNKQQLISTLQDANNIRNIYTCEEQVKDKIFPGNAINCFYYMLGIYNSLGLPIDKKAEISSYINTLEDQNGLYLSNIGSNDISDQNLFNVDFSSTDQALMLLNTFGAQPGHVTRVRDTLLSIWEHNDANMSVAQKLHWVSILSTVASSLMRLGINVNNLPNAQDRLTWLLSFRQIVLSLNPRATTLFLIKDWFNLLHILSPGENFEQKFITNDFVHSLLSTQSSDGSFSIFLKPQQNIDVQGTYLAIELITSVQYSVPGRNLLIEGLNKLLSDTGGFFPSLSINQNITDRIESTEITIEAYKLLGNNPITNSSKNILTNFVTNNINALNHLNTKNNYMDTLQKVYYLSLLTQYLDVNTGGLKSLIGQETTDFLKGVKNNQPLTEAQLVQCFYLSRLVQFDTTNLDRLETAINLMYIPIGAFGYEKTYSLESTWIALSTLTQLGSKHLQIRNKAKITSWIERHTTSNGSFTENGNTNIYSSYWALESLRIIGTQLPNKNQTAQWLHSLKGQQGGVMPEVNAPANLTLTSLNEALLISRDLNIHW